MDFVDPTTTSNAEAQENLGLRHSRACFAPENNTLADGVGDPTYTKYINRTTGKWENNGTDKAGVNLGRQWFIYNPDNNAGTNTTPNNTASSWWEVINSFTTSTVWHNSVDDNKKHVHVDMVDGTDVNSPKWNNVPMWNGAMALYGIKGLANGTGTYYNFKSDGTGLEVKAFTSANSKVIFDWDDGHRGGDGGTWCLTASYTTDHIGAVAGDSKRRFPHVYGGVRIPPSISELMGRFFSFYPMFRGAPYANEGIYQNNWPSYHSNNDTGSDSAERTSNNTTLAPKNSGADNRSNDGGIWGTSYNDSTNSYDWQLSNGCGFGIGSAPMHGVITNYDHQSSYDTNRPLNQTSKQTSQDHYQMFLNYDYDQYSAKGYLTSKYEQFQNKPFLTGVDGIGKGIVWSQGRFNHWHITTSHLSLIHI